MWHKSRKSGEYYSIYFRIMLHNSSCPSKSPTEPFFSSPSKIVALLVEPAMRIQKEQQTTRLWRVWVSIGFGYLLGGGKDAGFRDVLGRLGMCDSGWWWCWV
ncbi:hypothetical protein Pfo_007033 [Paulownia fortunei]|nr:hypothetical protein Pfo_007033 [Paulownia fortunei]